MISDEERREVAERLRSASARRSDVPWMVEDLMLALGFRCYEDEEDQLFNRLADLIDRPTCCNVYDEIYDEYEGAVVKTASSAASAERSSRIARATASRGRSITARSAGERW